MSTRARLRTGAFAGSLTLLLSVASPAFAQTPDAPADPDGGGAVEVINEDTDTNDEFPNNQPDAGDNEQPSGNDRSVENGGSGNQGSSEADPDGTTNGGADVPGGPGGADLADQDGNNGCGNDDDFEDDNNGNCGGARPGDVAPVVSPVIDTGNGGAPSSAAPEAAVLGTTLEATTSLSDSKATPTEVLGVQQARSPQELARTGISTLQMAMISMGLIVLGLTLTSRSRVLAQARAS